MKRILLMFFIVILISGCTLTKDKKETVKETTIDFKKEVGNLNKTIKVSNKDVLIEYTQDLNIAEGPKTLKIAGKEVANKNFWCGGPNILTTQKDSIVVSYRVGCASGFYQYIEIYNINGNKLLKIDKLNDLGMVVNANNVENSYTIKDNVITYKGTRFGSATGGLLFSGDQLDFIDICDKAKRDSRNVKDTDLVNATYEIEYLSTNKYSDPKITESETVKDYVDAHCE